MYWKNPLHPPPAPPDFGKGKLLPETSSSWLSRLTLYWLGQILDVGFSRPLMDDDLWEMPPARHASNLADQFENNFYSRCPPEKRSPAFRHIGGDFSRHDTESKQEEDNEEIASNKPSIPAVYDESLFKALLTTFRKRVVLSTILLIISDTLKTTGPLVNKVFLTWLTDRYSWHLLSPQEKAGASSLGLNEPRGVGYGVGVALGLVAMQVGSSLFDNHSALASMSTGLYSRTGLIGTIFRKSLRLSGKSRTVHTVGQITTMISVDCGRIEEFVANGPHLISDAIQLLLAIGLLIWNLGYITFVGFGVIVVIMPILILLIGVMQKQAVEGVKITDKRVRLTTEVLQGIRLLKVYGWEQFYIDGIMRYRQAEMRTIKKASVAVAVLFAIFAVLPVLATIVTFIAYSLTGHDLSIPVIFSALQLFNILRMPLIMLPMVLSDMANAIVSAGRIRTFLLSEELSTAYTIEPGRKFGLHVDGDFQWESLKGLVLDEKPLDIEAEAKKIEEEQKLEEEKAKKKKQEEKARKKAEKRAKGGRMVEETEKPIQDEPNQTSEEPPVEEQPFGLQGLKFDVPKGSFVAIVGKVGSGKSSILQALIGEMKKTSGEIIFGGSVAYVPQIPWIKNATLRDNILFGKPYNEAWFQEILRACSLEHDLKVLPHGDRTEIGEKGINLSGGQKARISLARAVYSNADIILLDDPLSAVDTHVGQSILNDCLLSGPLANRTRILVTHALHVLDKTEHIFVMDNGRIIEQGSYLDLMTSSVTFRRLVEEYGNQESGRSTPERIESKSTTALVLSDAISSTVLPEIPTLMETEERNTGAVSGDVYKGYLQNGGGLFWVPLIFSLFLLSQAGSVASNLVLGFWTGRTIPHFKNGEYMAVYGGIGGALAILTFLSTYSFILLGIRASLSLYHGAIEGVLKSPVSFFDTTPMGRISSRLTKDQETIDTSLMFNVLQFFSSFFNIFGTVGLVFYAFPYLGIIFAPLVALYYITGLFYRRSSVETKRLDSVLRSQLYASFAETLTGLATIRAYSKQASSIKGAQQGLDAQNRAYQLNLMMQRWLALRLDLFGNLLLLGICLFGAGTSNTVNPAKTSVVLTYTLLITQTFSEIISLFASCEQDMNAVERVLHYGALPAEGNRYPNTISAPANWPDRGEIIFKTVHMSYRAGLPEVLKGVNFSIRPGEKVGIVGRTGSGKSSLIQTLLRLVEINNGEIIIDDLNVANVNLIDLRHRIGFVPQDTTLFLGNLRENLDPQHLRTDAELISVLQRTWLLPQKIGSDPILEAKFSLDALVGDEGSNYSAGEKQLLALARALVKNSRIIVLDEATSSVDVETDAKVQHTIKTEFSSSTLLCIAHRLNTIAYYDRILVMDDGRVAEFDTVLSLFDQAGSIFRSLCDEAGLGRSDILKLRSENLFS